MLHLLPTEAYTSQEWFDRERRDIFSAYANTMYYWFFGGQLPLVSTQIGSGHERRMVMEMIPEILWSRQDDVLKFDFSREIAMAADPTQHDALVNQLIVPLTGTTDEAAKARIKEAFAFYTDNPEWVVQTIAFMITISPEITVQEA